MNTIALHEIEFTSPPGTVDLVHDLLDRVWAETAGVGEADRFCFETALIELVANVLQHAGDGRGVRCHLSIEVHDDRIRATLLDDARASTVRLEGRAMPRASAEAGRGIPLIRVLVNEFEHTAEDGHNQWRISRRFTR